MSADTRRDIGGPSKTTRNNCVVCTTRLTTKIQLKEIQKMANIKTAVRNALVAGIDKQSDVKAAEHVLETKREGKAAIHAKSAEVFTEVCETLEQDFRFNRRGIAEKYGIAQAKLPKTGKPKVDKDGNPMYTVPSSLRTVKSGILKGFRYKIDFGTIAKPTPFSVIRTQCAVAADEELKATRTPDDEARDVIRGVLENIGKALQDVDGKKALTASLKLVQELAQAIEKQAA
jgi:hypothetical protein